MKIARMFLIIFTLASGVAHANETDLEDSKDHPEIPRVKGTWIDGYAYSQYDAGLFAIGDDEGFPTVVRPEGKRTRIIYIGQEDQSSLQLFRNFQRAFAQMGELAEVYSCHREACDDAYVADKVVWPGDSRFETNELKRHHYGNVYTHDDPMYFHGTVQKGDTLYHVSVFTSMTRHGHAGIADGRPIANLEIVEVEEFEPSLVDIDASEITSQLETRGHVALYGIQFDFDSATLQEASLPTIAEVAKTLQADKNVSVFVVGHSDSEGSYEYNRELSEKRAASVVEVLAANHGIDPDRLVAAGVGPVAPKASNDSEDGRTLNRRVEIVRR